MLLVALLYFAYWVYLFLRNPFRDTRLKIFITFVESEMCLLHIVYFFVVASGMEGDTASEVALTRWVTYIVMLQMATYAFFAIFFLYYMVKAAMLEIKKRKRYMRVQPDHSAMFGISGI